VATRFGELLGRLASEHVDFVLIGGLALIAQGASRATVDVDICYDRASANLERLTRALGPLHPRLRGAPPELPFFFDARTLRSGLNFTLVTDFGEIDLLGEVTGIGGFTEASRDAVELTLYGHTIRVMNLDQLERAKRAAGRAKDLLDLAEIARLRAARDEP